MPIVAEMVLPAVLLLVFFEQLVSVAKAKTEKAASTDSERVLILIFNPV